MSRNFLTGPLTAAQARDPWQAARDAGRCRVFGAGTGLDLAVGPTDSWDDVRARLPGGWRPDFVVLHLARTLVPPALWRAPVPLVGLAADWDLLWHGYRRLLPLCDLVLADAPGVAVMHRAGLTHARPANLNGLGPNLLWLPPDGGPRDIDVLFLDGPDRDLRLLRLEEAEDGGHPFTLFNLGMVLRELGRPAEALPLLRRSLERSRPQDSIVRKLYALIAACHRGLGQAREAEAACAEGLRAHPDDTELLFFCLQQGRLEEAEAHWRAALADRPGFVPAWLGLGEVRLRRGAWDGLEEVARALGSASAGEGEAALLRARAHLARGECPAARALLGPLITRSPDAVGPRVLLSIALLREGSDPAAAEAALRDVLALEPGNAGARHNLELLLRQRHGQPPGGPAAGAA
jgi:Flp pilus assembly protein TadD